MINFTRIGLTVIALLGLSVHTFAQSLFSEEKVISGSADGATKVVTADLDGDGDIDVLSASRLDGKIAWYENDGNENFTTHIITESADDARSVFAADLDGDGDWDVLSASAGDDKIAWYENDGSGTFGPQQVITNTADGAVSVIAADLDDDGDMDVLYASFGSSPNWNNRIAWYENIDGQGSFGPEQVITTDVDGVESAIAADLNGDGDLDVLSASFEDDTIAWYENTDGLGAFGPQQVITTTADAAFSVFATDLNGDGHIDVLSAAALGDKIAWYKNMDGLGDFGPEQVITTDADGALSVFAADLDGDGNMDVLSASTDDDKIAWYENDGSGTFGPQQVLNTPDEAENPFFSYTVFAADLDGDGDMDVLSASALDDEIAWYENSLIDDPTSISRQEAGDVPNGYALFNNYPNPFNPETSINFTVPKISRVTLAIYDILGRKIRTLVSAIKAAGSYNVTWNGKNNQGQPLASGLYFYNLQAGEFSSTKKMMLLK